MSIKNTKHLTDHELELEENRLTKLIEKLNKRKAGIFRDMRSNAFNSRSCVRAEIVRRYKGVK